MFETNHALEAALAEGLFNHLGEVLGLVLLDLDGSAAGDAKRHHFQHDMPGNRSSRLC